jgi:hypothetical protein
MTALPQRLLSVPEGSGRLGTDTLALELMLTERTAAVAVAVAVDVDGSIQSERKAVVRS